jgi:hypothetical protein
VGEQARDVHLGDAELAAYVGLGHAVLEAQEQDPLLAGRQLLPVRCDGLHAEHVLQSRVILAEKVSHDG